VAPSDGKTSTWRLSGKTEGHFLVLHVSLDIGRVTVTNRHPFASHMIDFGGVDLHCSFSAFLYFMALCSIL
jgi:hypothetical protein